MKKAKLILAVVLVGATVSAFASAKSIKSITAFYIDDSNHCVQADEPADCIVGNPSCEVFTGTDLRQAYASATADPVTELPCSQPLEEEE